MTRSSAARARVFAMRQGLTGFSPQCGPDYSAWGGLRAMVPITNRGGA